MPAPASNHANPTLTLWVVGRYVIHLQVWDRYGQPSTLATYEVFVTRSEGLTVELTWHTPGDPDAHDEGPVAGADLDLHLLHPLAGEDGWFDIPFDAFWFNDAPSWGVFQVATDDPTLYRDDTDGSGPEGIGLVEPESGVCYRVGVHVWDDHGYGASKATVRVYEFGNLVFEASEALEMLDLWEVTTVCWPPVAGSPPRLTRVCEGSATPCDDARACADGSACTTHVTPGYTSDVFTQ